MTKFYSRKQFDKARQNTVNNGLATALNLPWRRIPWTFSSRVIPTVSSPAKVTHWTTDGATKTKPAPSPSPIMHRWSKSSAIMTRVLRATLNNTTIPRANVPGDSFFNSYKRKSRKSNYSSCFLVRVSRFELEASWTPFKRDTKLRHTRIYACLSTAKV